MLEELLPYYERELGYLRELTGEFATRYPKIARRLQIDADQCEDPHVERLIEAFAFIAARIHRKLDDDYPEIAEAFIQVLYPHYTSPIPSATILHLRTESEKPEISGRYVIPRHQAVLSPEVQGIRCRYSTCFEVDLWPVSVAGAKLELAQNSEYLRRLGPAEAVITLDLLAQGNLNFAALKIDKLRFFLDGNPPLMHLLYELLFSKLSGVRISDGTDHPDRVVVLPKESIRPVGFEDAESLLESDPRSFQGYRLLSEYFAFADKFMFFDITGLDNHKLLHGGNRLRIQFILSSYADSERHIRLLQGLSAQNFKLGCVPVVNLFKQTADPIRITHQQAFYPVVVDGRKPGAFEVYSIDSVKKIEKSGSQETSEEVPPFYSVNHFTGEDKHPFHWYGTRKASFRKNDKGTDMEIALVDLDFKPVRPEAEILSLELYCTNRDLPDLIPFGGTSGTQEGFTVPNHSVIKRAWPLRKPTSSLRPPSKRGLQWRLVSHLSLNQLSLASQGKEALQEVLGLYNYSDSPAMARQVQGIHSLESRPTTARIPGREFASFARGIEIRVTFDEDYYIGSNLYLFASILERFFGHFCAPNSFVKFSMYTKQQEGEVAQWPSRAGEMAMI